MRRAAAALGFVLLSATIASAQDRHPCAGDAVAKAMPLLRLHVADPEGAQAMAVDARVRTLPPIKALTGNGRFDVLEVWGHTPRRTIACASSTRGCPVRAC
jgi:hypothetical protein